MGANAEARGPPHRATHRGKSAPSSREGRAQEDACSRRRRRRRGRHLKQCNKSTTTYGQFEILFSRHVSRPWSGIQWLGSIPVRGKRGKQRKTSYRSGLAAATTLSEWRMTSQIPARKSAPVALILMGRRSWCKCASCVFHVDTPPCVADGAEDRRCVAFRIHSRICPYCSYCKRNVNTWCKLPLNADVTTATHSIQSVDLASSSRLWQSGGVGGVDAFLVVAAAHAAGGEGEPDEPVNAVHAATHSALMKSRVRFQGICNKAEPYCCSTPLRSERDRK